MWAGNAAIAVAFTGYLSSFLPSIGDNNLLSFFISIGLVWFLSIINIIGVHFAGIFQLVLTIIKVIPILLIGLVGIFFIKTNNLVDFNVSGQSNIFAFSHGMMLTLWAFLGMESASIPADVVKNPKKTIPMATILGTLIVSFVYIITTIAIMGIMPIYKLKDSIAPFSDAAYILFGNKGRVIIGISAIISCVGALNGWILLQGHVPFAAAKDNLFPKKFKNISNNGTPVFGIIISSILVTILLIFNFNKSLVDQFTFIISLATLSAIIAYLYTSISEFVIYVKYPNKVKEGKIVLSLFISFFAFIYSFWAIISCGKEIVFYGVLLMFTSIPIYGFMELQKYKENK